MNILLILTIVCRMKYYITFIPQNIYIYIYIYMYTFNITPIRT